MPRHQQTAVNRQGFGMTLNRSFALAASLVLSSLLVATPVFAKKSPAATVTCTDGSTSKGGKGACSHHGGIKKDADASAPAATPAEAAPAPSEKSAPAKTESSSSSASGADADGATAKCKDGTYSHSKHHSGSCSHHGGVAEFLDKK